MATLGGTVLTLNDWGKRVDPDGSVSAVAEILSQKNEILEDMLWMEGNLPTGHRSTQRTGLPTGTWRVLNEGVANEKSNTVQVTDTIGMLETYAETDKALADLNGNTAAFRASEDSAFLEGLAQTMGSTIIYGNTDVNPERFMGLAPRYNDTTATNGGNIIDAGGTGSDNLSIWLIVWGENTVHGVFPKGSTAGLQVEDKGQVTLQDSNNDNYEGYRTHYKWDAGLVVRDWRYICRIANIDVSDLTKDAATGADIIDLMVQSLETVESLTPGKPVFYVNKTVRSFLRRQTSNKSNVNLFLDDAGGKKVLFFDEVPVRRVDQLTLAEAQVT